MCHVFLIFNASDNVGKNPFYKIGKKNKTAADEKSGYPS